MGRPKLPVDEARSVVVTAMVRPTEQALLAERAKQLDTSRSVLVRRALLEFLAQQEPVAAAGSSSTTTTTGGRR